MRNSGCKVKVKKGNESEKLEEICKNVKKVRKRFWWKWLSFVKGRWPGQGVLRSEVGSKSVAGTLKSLGTSDRSNATSMDIIEIPIEPGQKISKILIKPTRTGIKAMIAQSRSPLCANRTPREKKWPPSENTSWGGKSLGHSETKLSEECGQSRDRSTSWSTKVFKKETGMTPSKETLLTSALFIREDLDSIVESAVFIEPNLPNDYPLSRKSDDLSQKSVKINKKRVSYRIIDERNDDFLKTIKTISEPTWMERENILRRQRMHENINNLLEQFLFLESDDVIGLTIPRSKPAQDRKTIQFDGPSSQLVGGHPHKEISREVSPEILVNKKPFKEYLSEDYLETGGSFHVSKMQRSQKSFGGPSRTGRKSKTGSEGGEERDPPTLREVFFSEERNHGDVSKNYSKARGGIQRITTMEREMTRTCYGDCEELSEVASLQCVEREDSPLCTIWGVCKTYSACNRTPSVEATPSDDSAMKKRKETLDELLDRLDDSDHDVVFQKNISQFRKKINVVPRLDLRKPKDSKKTEQKKAKRPQSYLESVKPIIECVVEESEEEEKEEMRKSFAVSNVLVVEKYADKTNSLRVFRRNFLLYTVKDITRRTLAKRTEEAIVKVMPRLREIYSLIVSSRRMVVQRETAVTLMLNKVYLTCKGYSEPHELPGKGGLSSFKTISMMFQRQNENLSVLEADELAMSKEDIPQVLPLFTNTTECFYVIQTPSFSSPQQLSDFNPKDLTLLGKSKLNEELKDSKYQTGRESEVSVIKVSELEGATSCGLQTVRVLSSELFDLYGCLDTPRLRRSELGASEDVIEMTSEAGNASKNSRTVDDLEKQDSYQVDGFQILYNNEKENLNDEEEEEIKTNSMRNLSERAQNIAFVVEEIEEEEEKEEEDQKEKEAEKKEMNSDESEKISKIVEKNLNRFLKFKSSSSPKESIIQNELGPQEHRARRSLILLKELEKDLQNSKKKRLSGDKGLEMRRTGSALPELHSAKQEVSFLQEKSNFGGSKAFASFIFPEEIKIKRDRPHGALDVKKMLAMDGGGQNMRKEVLAAFNSIRELTACKGEAKGGSKRMSLVIMLSKK